MDMKHILTHLIRAGRDALHLEKMLTGLGYDSTPYYNLHGEICDAVYKILGEDTETFEESVTYAAMNDCLTSDETCAEQLALFCMPDESDIPNATRAQVKESAARLGLSFRDMVNLILSEWAFREIMVQSMQ